MIVSLALQSVTIVSYSPSFPLLGIEILTDTHLLGDLFYSGDLPLSSGCITLVSRLFAECESA